MIKAININGLNVKYIHEGKKESPKFLFLHGIATSYNSSIKTMLSLCTLYAKHFDVYAPLHPGFRGSDVPDNAWSLDDYVEYVEKFVEQLGLDNFVLMGQSFGGKLSTAYALKHPNKVRLLALGGAAVSFKESPFHQFGIDHLIKSPSKFIFLNRFVRWFLGYIYARYILGTPHKMINRKEYKKYADMGASIANVLGYDLLPEVGKITSPTLLFWGKRDIIVPLKQGVLLHKAISNSRLYMFRSGHLSMVNEYKEKVMQIVLAALR